MKYIDKILESGNTVFKANEIALLLDIENKNTLKSILQRFKKAGIIIYH
jgi:transcription initiation factor IIE alpha subunit